MSWRINRIQSKEFLSSYKKNDSKKLVNSRLEKKEILLIKNVDKILRVDLK
jgi:hypothetical protein